MQNKAFSSWLHSYQQQALKLNERRLIVLVGEHYWSSALIKSIDSSRCDGAKQSESTWLVYGENDYIKSNVAKQRFRDKLGSESDYVVFLGSALSIDAFAGLSGTLVAGGILFLLIEDMQQVKKSLFYKRFFNLLHTFSEHVIIEQDAFYLPILTPTNPQNVLAPPPIPLTHKCVTQEQLTAVEAVIKVFKGKRNRPLVLTADRGRGKSSALAIACGELLRSATKECRLRLVITAPDLKVLSVFFHQLVTSLPEGDLQQGKFSVQYACVEFIPVDQLLKQPVAASLVLVDEAAAIPIYLLEQLLLNHARLVFASTVHGYEGAGRGFTLKFQKTLTVKYPHWKSLHFHQPIRWGMNDPLEKLIFEACLLNAELPEISAHEQKIRPSQLLFKQFSATELATNEALLKQVFSVLVTAHYQTKPSDVQMLLDNRQVQLVCLLSQEAAKQQVVAVALLVNEGMCSANIIKAEDISAVNQSKRRLKNHFVPQSLLTQCGIEHAFNYHYLRVMRIAVHPQLQQQGVGTYFLAKITEFSILHGVDFLAASFGATSSLLSFWLTNDFHLARIGFKQDKASGEQSALVLKALTQSGEKALCDINTEFYRCFDYLLVDEYKSLPADLVALILHDCPPEYLTPLSVRDKTNVAVFAQGHRQFSSCAFSLNLWLKHQLVTHPVLEDKRLWVLISRIMQKHSISDVCTNYGFTGKKTLEQFLRDEIGELLK